MDEDKKRFLLEDYIRKVELEMDRVDDEYQKGNPMLRDAVWGYHNRLRTVMLIAKQDILRNEKE